MKFLTITSENICTQTTDEEMYRHRNDSRNLLPTQLHRPCSWPTSSSGPLCTLFRAPGSGWYEGFLRLASPSQREQSRWTGLVGCWRDSSGGQGLVITGLTVPSLVCSENCCMSSLLSFTLCSSLNRSCSRAIEEVAAEGSLTVLLSVDCLPIDRAEESQ